MIQSNMAVPTCFSPWSIVASCWKDSSQNGHRVRHYAKDGNYNIAVHTRRGDILDKNRWIKQSVFAKVARTICGSKQGSSASSMVDVHIFSSGLNRDGNWTELEQGIGKDTCRSIQFHLDEYEFDTWAHLVTADALVLSKSAFSYAPVLFS